MSYISQSSTLKNICGEKFCSRIHPLHNIQLGPQRQSPKKPFDSILPSGEVLFRTTLRNSWTVPIGPPSLESALLNNTLAPKHPTPHPTTSGGLCEAVVDSKGMLRIKKESMQLILSSVKQKVMAEIRLKNSEGGIALTARTQGTSARTGRTSSSKQKH